MGIIVGSFGLSEDTSESVSTTVSKPTERTITSTTFQAESQLNPIVSNSFLGSSEINSISNSDNYIPTLIQKADAITADQNELSVTRYSFQDNLRSGVALDSSGNIFAGGSNKVGRIDVTTNTQTTWTIPNDQGFRHNGIVDSNGFYYFTISDSDSQHKIVKLDHTTDIFTEWNVPPSNEYRQIYLKIDSLDNIFRDVNFHITDPLENLNVFVTNISRGEHSNFISITSTGGFATISLDIISPSGDTLETISDTVDSNGITRYEWRLSDDLESGTYTVIVQDSFGTAAQTTFSLNPDTISNPPIGDTSEITTKRVFLEKFNPVSNTLTYYSYPSEFTSEIYLFETLDSLGNLYFVLSNSKILKLNPTTNAMTVWADLPTSPRGLAVDSLGKIYFGERFNFRDKIAELDPSTNVLKEWTIPFKNRIDNNIVVDSSGNIFFGESLTRFVPSTNTFTQWGSSNLDDLSISDGKIIGVAGSAVQIVS